jgi:hypothetical protein
LVLTLNNHDFISVKNEEQPDEQASLLSVGKSACATMQRSEHSKLRKCANCSVWLEVKLLRETGP